MILMVLSLFASCGQEAPLFEALPPEQTGIDFNNRISISDTFNAVLFEYIYNGGGVGAGDLNGDGLTDLVFSGNMVSSRLYLNGGDFHFVDVTEKAGIETSRWCTGVSLVDINGDGRTDIYLSVAGFQRPEGEMANLLFINEGNDPEGVPRFSERAAAYGLDDTGYSTQAAFFDYDRDGDLDAYLLTNALESFNRNRIRAKATAGEGKSNDRLYRNNADGTFTEVTREAGILVEGYGLGISIVDIDQDGWPDIYCANDFLTNDLLWINNRDGTFTNRADDYLKHQTHNGMGVDVADINNDCRPEIAVLDMLPEDNLRQKMMVPNDNYDMFLLRFDYGYQPQYMRNTLQLHQGYLPNGEPRFSEIGFLAGLSATDWSWSVLFADLDNDGWKDAYITNGYRKDVTNLDYVRYSDLHAMFGTEESKRQRAFLKMEELPEVKISNYLFHNQGDLTFENRAREWGLATPSFSNGAIYADLDADGDLDLVVNNIDAPAFVYRNRQRERAGRDRESPAFLRLRFDVPAGFTDHLNAKVWVYAGPNVQYQEYSPYRGYKSTVEPFLHFGLGPAARADSILIRWANGKSQRLGPVEANQLVDIPYAPEEVPIALRLPQPPALFSQEEDRRGLHYRHSGNPFIDFKTTRTLPHMHSEAGPAIAIGDIDGDGLEDVFVGGDAGQAGRFFLQGAGSTFREGPMLPDSLPVDMGALLFDAEMDGDLDLYVVSGGAHLPMGDAGYQDRLYRNDGTGRFEADPGALPPLSTSGSVVRASDFDGDGDLDLFVGGRLLPGRYPLAPRSYLLRNTGGSFVDATQESAPDLLDPGLVSAARWTDYNNDGQMDLIVCGEWMPVCFYRNEGGQLLREDPQIFMAGQGRSIRSSEGTVGWWNSIAGADLDEDGDMDYVLGNLGRNARLQADQDHPIRLYAADFDHNGAIDPVITYEQEGAEYALHARDNLIDQIAGMKGRFPDYRSYGEAVFDRTLSPEEQSQAEVFEARLFASGILENREDGFAFHPLPAEAQVAPLFGLDLQDVNGDGKTDILAIGNLYGAEQVLLGRYDASFGHVLLNQGDMRFFSYPALASGLVVEGEGRSLGTIGLANGELLALASQHADSLLVFRTLEPPAGPAYRPHALDAALVVDLEDGRSLRVEIPYGEGYLGQGSRTVRLPAPIRKARIIGFNGQERIWNQQTSSSSQ